MTKAELTLLIERERLYYGDNGSIFDVLLNPPATAETLDALERDLQVALPEAYRSFLSYADGIWLKQSLSDPADPGGLPLEQSAGLYESRIVSKASLSVRDMLDYCMKSEQKSSVVAIGQDGLIGDRIALSPNEVNPAIVLCSSDEPTRLFDPLFLIESNFDSFLRRLLGASVEGRANLLYWME